MSTPAHVPSVQPSILLSPPKACHLFPNKSSQHGPSPPSCLDSNLWDKTSPYWIQKTSSYSLGGTQALGTGTSSPPLPLPTPFSHSPENLSYLSSFNCTHSFLNKPNPALAQDCWLCLSFSSAYRAIPVPLLQWNQAKATFTYEKEKGAIFLDKANTLLGSYSTTQANQASLLHLHSNPCHCGSHLHTCHRPCHPTHPANCPSPLYFTRSQGNISIGHLPSSPCNATVTLVSGNWGASGGGGGGGWASNLNLCQ